MGFIRRTLNGIKNHYTRSTDRTEILSNYNDVLDNLKRVKSYDTAKSRAIDYLENEVPYDMSSHIEEIIDNINDVDGVKDELKEARKDAESMMESEVSRTVRNDILIGTSAIVIGGTATFFALNPHYIPGISKKGDGQDAIDNETSSTYFGRGRDLTESLQQVSAKDLSKLSYVKISSEESEKLVEELEGTVKHMVEDYVYREKDYPDFYLNIRKGSDGYKLHLFGEKGDKRDSEVWMSHKDLTDERAMEIFKALDD